MRVPSFSASMILFISLTMIAGCQGLGRNVNPYAAYGSARIASPGTGSYQVIQSDGSDQSTAVQGTGVTNSNSTAPQNTAIGNSYYEGAGNLSNQNQSQLGSSPSSQLSGRTQNPGRLQAVDASGSRSIPATNVSNSGNWRPVQRPSSNGSSSSVPANRSSVPRSAPSQLPSRGIGPMTSTQPIGSGVSQNTAVSTIPSSYESATASLASFDQPLSDSELGDTSQATITEQESSSTNGTISGDRSVPPVMTNPNRFETMQPAGSNQSANQVSATVTTLPGHLVVQGSYPSTSLVSGTVASLGPMGHRGWETRR